MTFGHPAHEECGAFAHWYPVVSYAKTLPQRWGHGGPLPRVPPSRPPNLRQWELGNADGAMARAGPRTASTVVAQAPGAIELMKVYADVRWDFTPLTRVRGSF